MWYPFEYTPEGKSRAYVALEVLGTFIAGTEDRYAIMPAHGFPDDYKPAVDKKTGQLIYWPMVTVLGQTVFNNEHEVYSCWMRRAAHKEGELRLALASYQHERERWRKRWMQAMNATESDARKLELGY